MLTSCVDDKNDEILPQKLIPKKNLQYFGFSAKPIGEIKIYRVLSSYVEKEKNELSVKVGDSVIVDFVDFDLGWVFCRLIKPKINNQKILDENMWGIGFVPLDCFAKPSRWDSKNSKTFKRMCEVISKKEEYPRFKVGDKILVGRKDNKSLKHWCTSLSCVFRDYGSNYFNIDGVVEDISLKSLKELSIKMKTKKVVQLKDVLPKLPFRVVVDLIGKFVLFKPKTYGKNQMKQFYGRFIADKSKTVFCIFQSVKICWSGFKESLKLLPVRKLRHIELFLWSDGGHVPFGSYRIKTTLPLLFWKSCPSIRSIGELIIHNGDRKEKKNTVNILNYISDKMETINTITIDRITEDFLKALSRFKNIHKLGIEIISEKTIEKFESVLDLDLCSLVDLNLYKHNDTNVISFEKVPKLKKLNLRYGKLSSRQINGLLICKNLRVLRLDKYGFENMCDLYRVFMIPTLNVLQIWARNEYKPFSEGDILISKEEVEKFDLVDPKLCKFSDLCLWKIPNVPKLFLSQTLLMKNLKSFKIYESQATEEMCKLLEKANLKSKLSIRFQDSLTDEKEKEVKVILSKIKNLDFSFYNNMK